MARKSRSKKASLSASLALGALAAADVASGSVGGTLDQEIRISSAKLTWGLEQHTAGQGPIVVGLADADLTAAEIEECLEATASFNIQNRVAREQATRPVRIVGIFNGQAGTESLNDGNPIFTRCGFHGVDDGSPIQIFALNKDQDVLTTGTSVVVTGSVWYSPV